MKCLVVSKIPLEKMQFFVLSVILFMSHSTWWVVLGFEENSPIKSQINYPNIEKENLQSSFRSLGFTSNVNVKGKVFVESFLALPAELKLIILGYLSPRELYDFIQIVNFKEYHHLASEAYGTVYGDTVVSIRNSKKKRNFLLENNIIHFSDLSEFHSATRT